jgi:NAD(P)-dependent dehydrogenase (short-subunit alcohol dehydrogenase family)
MMLNTSVPSNFDGAHSARVDVTVAPQIDTALASVLSHSTSIDILVKHARYFGKYKPCEHFDSSEWEYIVFSYPAVRVACHVRALCSLVN